MLIGCEALVSWRDKALARTSRETAANKIIKLEEHIEEHNINKNNLKKKKNQRKKPNLFQIF